MHSTPYLIIFAEMFRIFAVISFLLASVPAGLCAETGDSALLCGRRMPPVVFETGADIRGGGAFASYKDDILGNMLEHNGDVPHDSFYGSLHLKFGFRFTDTSRFGKFYPGGRQGIGISATTFGNRKGVGTPVAAYVWQGGPIKRFSSGLSLNYEWNFGASFGWKPSDGRTASSSLIVGSHVNAYINVGFMAEWTVSPGLALTGGLEFTHYSNGNTSFPNPGVNTAGLRVGMTYVPAYRKMPAAMPRIQPDTSKITVAQCFGYDLVAYGAVRKRVYRGGEDPVLLNGHFTVAGINFMPMYEVCRYFRAGLSADFQWDESTDLKHNWAQGTESDDIRFYRPKFLRQVYAGLSARAELVMPIFSVNAGIGVILAGPPETRGSYQMLNLKTYVTRSLFINIGYQLFNFSQQSNLMLGLGYTFNSPRRRIGL